MYICLFSIIKKIMCMVTIISRVLPHLLITVLVSAAIPYKVFAQTQNATSEQGSNAGCVATLCGTISNPGQAVDGDPATAATITPPAAVGTVSLRVGFASPVLSGTRVRARVSFTSPGTLSLTVAQNTGIRTYNRGGSTVVQSVASGLNTITDGTIVNIDFVASANFDDLELYTSNMANANSNYSVLLYDAATLAPLPVELTTFTGKSRAAAVELNWATASEKNNAHFVVERATEAQNQYKRLGELAGAGNSTHATTYSFVDAQPVGLGYYRLRQVDLNGTSTYSPAIAVQSTSALVLLAYPNPSTGLVTVAGPPHTRFTIVNRLGQIVQRGEVGVSNTCQVDLRGLTASVYFLREEATGAVVKIATAGTDAPQ